MNACIPQMNGLAGLWIEAMGRACCQGGLVLLLVWLVDRTFRRLPAQARVWLWRLAYLKLLVAFVWASPIRLPLLAARPSPGPAPTPTVQATFARRSKALPIPPESTQTVPQVSPAAAARPAPSRPSPSAATLLLAVWGLGVGWFGARLVGDLRRARRLRHTAQPALNERLAALCSQWSARFGLCRPPDLRVSMAVATPLVLGVRRPLVLLPATLAHIAPDIRRPEEVRSPNSKDTGIRTLDDWLLFRISRHLAIPACRKIKF
jgi:beta-lactamase regulating signal transducer with metallopeptidase domain